MTKASPSSSFPSIVILACPESDIVCSVCGAVAGNVENPETLTPKYTISLTAERKLGSSHIIDPSLPFAHLNKKQTARMINRDDVYMEYFSRVCDDLKASKNISRNAFYLFSKLRHTKLGLGRIAVFCISHAYGTSGVICDDIALIHAVQNRFRLRRKITISQSLYRVKPVAIEMNLIENTPDSESLTFRKNICPDNYHKATVMLNSFAGNHTSRTKSIQNFLDAYENTPACIVGK